MVTGGTGVLGGAIARGLARSGAKLAILGRRSERTSEVANEIRAEGEDAIALTADVLDGGQLREACRALLREWGRIDVLVNAAGGNSMAATVIPDGSVFDLDPDAVRTVIDLNLMGTFLPTQIFGEAMAEHGKGSIVNISSMAAQKPLSRLVGYSAAKAAVDNLTGWLADHLALSIRGRSEGERDRSGFLSCGAEPGPSRRAGRLSHRSRRGGSVAHPDGAFRAARGPRGRGGLARIGRERIRDRGGGPSGRRFLRRPRRMTVLRALAASPGSALDDSSIRDVLCRALEDEVAGERVLLVVPDHTREARLARIVPPLLEVLGRAKSVQALVALGTHPPLSAHHLEELVGVPTDTLAIANHEWDDPRALAGIGTIQEEQLRAIAGECWHQSLGGDVEVRVNRAATGVDRIVILGPTLPHEVAGFSGGAKYLFPGISGPEMINVMHWLGALAGVMSTIGVQRTPVRALIDAAAQKLTRTTPVALVALVTGTEGISGLFVGDLFEAWSESVGLAAELHVTWLDHPYERVISSALPIYDELWTAGKAMYKLEPVVADGGELVVHSPGLSVVSRTHGRYIFEVGYHVLPYFLSQWSSFESYPLAVLAHSTHVKGMGTFSGGVESPRIGVSLSTAIPATDCERLNLGYVDPALIDLSGADEKTLVVRRAGETLYRLRRPLSPVVVLMGVSGSGKTTIGRALATRLGWDFADGDSYHSAANIEKMRSGRPLDDADRAPWLARLHEVIDAYRSKSEPLVLACSALKDSYRRVLVGEQPGVLFVYLHASQAVIASRLAQRRGHYMPAQLLASQLETLEPPADAAEVDVEGPVEEVVRRTVEAVRARIPG